jgi:hypothetical protein
LVFIGYVTSGQHFPTQQADATLESCPKVFFDFDRDLLWLGKVKMPTFIQAVDTKDRHALRNIALDITEV